VLKHTRAASCSGRYVAGMFILHAVSGLHASTRQVGAKRSMDVVRMIVIIEGGPNVVDNMMQRYYHGLFRQEDFSNQC
jgi:hypothetical protein